MKKTSKLLAICLLCYGGMICSMQHMKGQSGALAVLDSALLNEQMDYIQERTRVYNDYRAIREDVFQKIKRNVQDSLMGLKLDIAQLNSKLQEQAFQIESLNQDLQHAEEERDEAIRTKDSLSFLGMQTSKLLYNSILWFIILGLAVTAGIFIYLFRRSFSLTRGVKNELDSTQEEFENYRKSSREKYEKLVVSHHHEIMKLKNS